MLIDTFKEEFLDILDARAAELSAPDRLYLLVDGAFAPGLHKTVPSECKKVLFASLPGFNDTTADASPFLTLYLRGDRRMHSLLRRCSGWPMLSSIRTPESLDQLYRRLSAWCVVEADGQRFNFRFPDTRRLPAIFRTLGPSQRAQFAGPVVHWSYLSRDGCWDQLDVSGTSAEPAVDPVLSDQQFAALVDDSRADELLVLLSDRGYEVHKHPSAGHARVSTALRVAATATLADDDVLSWCAWFWQYGDARRDCSAEAAFQSWQNTFLMEK